MEIVARLLLWLIIRGEKLRKLDRGMKAEAYAVVVIILVSTIFVLGPSAAACRFNKNVTKTNQCYSLLSQNYPNSSKLNC